MAALQPTHIRLKTGNHVCVERIYDTLVVRSMKGKVLGHYGPKELEKFHKRYKAASEDDALARKRTG